MINDAKLGGAKALGKGMTKFLSSEYSSLPAEMKCAEEAAMLGEKVRLWAEDQLDAKPKENGIMGLSVGGEAVKLICGTIASKFIPEFLAKEAGEYPCFSKKLGDEAENYIKDKLCNSIEF